MTTDPMSNIIHTYLSASPSEVTEGMSWYSHVNEQVSNLCAMAGIPVMSGAGIVAAYSINTSWKRNWELAFDTLRGEPRTDSLGISVVFVNRILNGEHPLEVFGSSALKIRAFSSAIAEPLSSTTAVIDRHARDVAHGQVVGANKKVRKTEYNALSSAYSEAAELAGIHVNQMQAITWLAWRRKIGAK